MSQDLLTRFLAWLPLIVIAGGWIAYSRKTTREYGEHISRIEAINVQLVDTNRAIITELR